jgi:hypothetical protein
MAALARAVRMPIMADESVSTDHSLLEIICKRGQLVPKQGREERRAALHAAAMASGAAAGLGINPGNHPS